MSKSFNVSFTQTFKVALTEEAIQQTRLELSKAVQIAEANPEWLTDQQRAFTPILKGWLEGDDETLMARVLKQGIRAEVRDAFIESVKSHNALRATKFAPAQVEVTSRGN